MATAYSCNIKAIKSAGQRGVILSEPTNISTFFIDIIAKYQGWAFQAEYANRQVSQNPQGVFLLTNPYVLTGSGISTQLSYIFPSMYELAGRYTCVEPSYDLASLQPQTDIYTLGVTKYLSKHRNKMQLNLSCQREQREFSALQNFF